MSRKKTDNEQVLADAAGGEQGEEIAVAGEYGGPTLNDTSRQRVSRTGGPQESKAAKFKRLANKRVPRALKCLQYVENLGNRNQYTCTEAQADKIIEAIGIACQRVFARLKGSEADGNAFSL